MTTPTTDLCDEFEDTVSVAAPIFQSYGKRTMFSGTISTVKVHEDNVLVRDVLTEPGNGGVLVVDGGGSMRCALVGGNVAQLAFDNGWSGIVVYGCIRDAAEINAIDVGIKALNTHPRKSVKKGRGDRDLAVHFADVDFVPGHYLYADEDGVIVSENSLTDA